MYCCNALYFAGRGRIPGFVSDIYLLGKLVMQQVSFKVKLKDALSVLLLTASYKQVDFSVVNIDNLHCALLGKSTAIGSPQHLRWSSR